MTTLRDLCNIPEDKYLLMEMFENEKKVADNDLSEMTPRELKWAIEYQKGIGRTWSYKTTPYPYAIFIGLQQDVKNRPPVPLYNIIGGPMHGSTVGVKTLLKMGIEIPLPEL